MKYYYIVTVTIVIFSITQNRLKKIKYLYLAQKHIYVICNNDNNTGKNKSKYNLESIDSYCKQNEKNKL